MVKSDDQAIHYEAVGVIGNLVHSSLHIKRRVLDEGALQPVIGLLSSHCPESQREAALLLGQFATTEPEFKVRIVQRGAVTPLIQMLSNTDSQLREMAAFALGRLAQNPDNQVGICHAKGLRPLLDLLDTDVGNLQHNAAFALYGLADNEDNVPDIIREGTVQRLKDRELMVQASKDCVQKTLKRLEDKMSGRVLRYLIYLMTTSDRSVARRITVALAYLCKPPLCRAEDHRQIFMEKGGMDILLSMLVPKQLSAANPAGGVILPEAAACQKDAATALHILWQRVGSFAPAEEASVPPTPVARDDELLKDPALCDVTFVVEGRQEIHAHKIAFANAPVAFHDEMDARKTSTSREGSERDVVELPDVSRAAFEAMVRFTYAGELGEGLTVGDAPGRAEDVARVRHGRPEAPVRNRADGGLAREGRGRGSVGHDFALRNLRAGRREDAEQGVRGIRARAPRENGRPAPRRRVHETHHAHGAVHPRAPARDVLPPPGDAHGGAGMITRDERTRVTTQGEDATARRGTTDRINVALPHGRSLRKT